MKRRDGALVGAGAVLGALTVLAVNWVGDDRGGSPARAEREISAEHASIENGRDPGRDLGTVQRALTTPDTAGASPGGEPAGSEQRIARQLAVVNGKLEATQREKRELEAQLQNVQDELAVSNDPHGAAEEYDLDQEDWEQLAARGSIKYRVPCVVPPEYDLSPSTLGEGLTPEDGKSVMEAHRRSNARLWAVMRPLCLNGIPDPEVVDQLGTMTCLRIVQEQAMASNRFAIAEAQRHVAEVHAGLRPRPAPGASPSPLFDAYLALTSEGKLFEQDLAESFGPDEAHRIASSLKCVATMR